MANEEVPIQKINNEKTHEYVSGKELLLTEIEVKEDQNKIEKIYFKTPKSKITWKPKVERNSQKNGFTVTRKEKMGFDDIPKNIVEINREINMNGKAKIKGSYMVWRKKEENETKEINYVPGDYCDFELIKE